MTQTTSVADALKSILEEAPPKAQRDSVYEELKKQEKMIKAALKSGWSASQLAARLRKAGVQGSVERMRAEILRIGGIEAKKKRTADYENSDLRN